MTTGETSETARFTYARGRQAVKRELAARVRMMTIELSWPASELMQNRHDGRHWSYAADAKAAYKQEGYLRTLSAINTFSFEARKDCRYRITMTFYAPDNRRRDVSNLHAAMKSALDGIAEAMGIDDSLFVEHTQKQGAISYRGHVAVIVEEL